MAFNGSGVYNLPTGNPVVTNTTISSTWANNTLNDIGSALSNTMTKDGQSTPTGNLKMGGFKFTGMAGGSGTGESVRWEQLFSQGLEQSIASASTVDIGGTNTCFLNVTGTTAITSFGTNYNGPRYLRFTGVVTLTNSSTLICPGGADIVTAAGDVATVIPKATSGTADGWAVVGFQKNATPGTVDLTKLTSKLQPVTASVASNALTCTLNPTVLDFRSSTIGSGTVNTRTIGTAISAVVPSGATLGTVNATLSKVMLLAIDNAGTVELAVCNGSLLLDESTLISTTLLDSASDSATVIYSTAARTNVPFRIVGYVESTQSTAGTWATSPSKIQGIGGQIQSSTASGSGGGITSGTPVASTSGTAIDFTGIPSTAKRITVLFNGVSTNGASNYQVQLGSGSVTTSGYVGSCANQTGGTGVAFSAGFVFQIASTAPQFVNGAMYIALLGSNTWVETSNVSDSGASGALRYGAGSIALGGALDRVRITTANGTDTFDAGTINILWE